MTRQYREQYFQAKLVRQLRMILPSDSVLTAFPAGGGGETRGKYLKAMGLIPGMPDLLLFYDGQAFGFELKAKNRDTTLFQREMHTLLQKCGIRVRVVKTIDDALCALSDWDIPTRIKIAMEAA